MRATQVHGPRIGEAVEREPGDEAEEDGSSVSRAEIAAEVGLRYISDAAPGIRRIKSGRGFRYLDPNGRPVTDDRVLDRVRSLAIPPAWTDVWISPIASGHIQATGRDVKGRKQYIYHPLWRQMRDETKYHRMSDFGRSLPTVRDRVDRDLGLHGYPRERVLATIVRLLDETAIRIGNPEYARVNNSFGLTTLRAEHVDVRGQTLRLQFRAKGGKFLSLAVKDRRVANIVRRLEDLPGQEVFHYLSNEGELRVVDSSDVNEYLKEITGQAFTAKDFRTWAASVIAAEALACLGQPSSATDAKRRINQAIDAAANHLGNTRAICRASYVHPDVIQAYVDGWLESIWTAGHDEDPPGGIHPEETAMLAVLAEAARRKGNSSRRIA